MWRIFRRKKPDRTYYDLKLIQVGEVWFWELYLEGKRVNVGRTSSGIRAAYKQAVKAAEQGKIITAAVVREKIL